MKSDLVQCTRCTVLRILAKESSVLTDTVDVDGAVTRRFLQANAERPGVHARGRHISDGLIWEPLVAFGRQLELPTS